MNTAHVIAWLTCLVLAFLAFGEVPELLGQVYQALLYQVVD